MRALFRVRILAVGFWVFSTATSSFAEKLEIVLTFDTEAVGMGFVWDDAILGAASGNGTMTLVIDTDVADDNPDGGVGSYPEAIESVTVAFSGNTFTAETAVPTKLLVQLPVVLTTDNGVTSDIPLPPITLFDNEVAEVENYFYQFGLSYDPMDLVIFNDSIPNPFPDETMATDAIVGITKSSIPAMVDTSNFLFRLPITGVSQSVIPTVEEPDVPPTVDLNIAAKTSIEAKITKLQKKLHKAKKKGKKALAKKLAKKVRKLKKRAQAL